MIDENFINEWIKHQEDTYEDDDAELHWTDDYLINLLLNDQIDELWDFVMRTYKRELSQEVIGMLSAGALEDVLARKGEEYIGRVELLARNDTTSDIYWVAFGRTRCQMKFGQGLKPSLSHGNKR